MLRHPAFALISAAALAVALTGCGSDTTSSDAGTATTTTASTSVSTTVSTTTTKAPASSTTAAGVSTTMAAGSASASASAAPAPCEALTAAEYGAVMGGTATATPVNEGYPSCEYRTSGGDTIIRLEVQTGMAADMAVSQADPMEFQSVSGVGEALVVSSEGRQAVMKSGGAAYVLKRWQGTATPTQLTELMRSVIAG